MTPTFIVNVEVVIHHKDRYLMTLRSLNEAHAGGTYAFPGGKVEQHEIMQDVLEHVARREVREEVGLEVGPLTYLEANSFLAGDLPCINVVMMAPYLSGKVQVQEEELSAAEWLTLEEALSRKETPIWTRNSLKKAAQKRAELESEPHAIR
ncbi:NUDIX hydrolase [Deinococcus cellulosilyticus]|uniref:Nudix hydrolase domain-containing protein n=1 Tax=Deinococcus cellulosilyticus (strain DSM 18568 / NBRC 106333 / KACC 11606 / 5516J-15) TaxID=1223518 RepID=A0A511N0S8_DEIC1|nr:NUDIX domain-containing protein [Deinococcus cellulosilyticus]GEM46475.1 hypothetical protein DC3_21100 [Deinococcus cellulosilyticus NBRC 106333 = KACC 11606]